MDATSLLDEVQKIVDARVECVGNDIRRLLGVGGQWRVRYENRKSNVWDLKIYPPAGLFDTNKAFSTIAKMELALGCLLADGAELFESAAEGMNTDVPAPPPCLAPTNLQTAATLLIQQEFRRWSLQKLKMWRQRCAQLSLSLSYSLSLTLSLTLSILLWVGEQATGRHRQHVREDGANVDSPSVEPREHVVIRSPPAASASRPIVFDHPPAHSGESLPGLAHVCRSHARLPQDQGDVYPERHELHPPRTTLCEVLFASGRGGSFHDRLLATPCGDGANSRGRDPRGPELCRPNTSRCSRRGFTRSGCRRCRR